MKTPARLLFCALAASCAARQRPDAATSLRLAQEDLAAGRPEQAQQGFEQVLLQDPRELAAIRGRIEAARKRGALGPLLREVTAAASARPGDAQAAYTAGLAAFAQGDEPAAVRALGRAVALRPGEADFQYRLGLALFDGEKFAEAKEPLQRAAALAPKMARYRPPLAVTLGKLGDRPAAMAALQDFFSLAPTAEEAGVAAKAARSLTDLFRDLPPSSRGELEQALGFLSRDAPGLAVPQLEALLAKLPDLAAAHALLGLATARLDETGRAVTELRRAAELAPELPQPHAWLGELYAAKDKPEQAVAEYALALEKNPLDGESLRRLGTLRLERGLPGSLDALAPAALLAPEDDALQLLLARAEIAQGHPAPARTRLERLSTRRPEDAEILLRLALLLFDERAHSEGRARDELTGKVEKLVERVLAVQPENAAASKLLSALRAG